MRELSITKISNNLWPKGWREETCLMGVLNVTPDSFSDGGLYLDPELANRRASQLISDGANIIDIGAQSTRPKSEEVGIQEELRRLKPAILAIRKSNPEVLISVDTFNSKVAEKALDFGANWVNDISGGRRDPNMFSLVAETNCPFIITHSRGNSYTMDKLTNYRDITNDVCLELLRSSEEAIKAGVSSEQIIWDPGLGFAKNTIQNLTIIRELESICSNGFPVLLGPSRKRFIGKVLSESNYEKRIWGSAAIASRCVQANVALIRVHDVFPIKQTIRMAKEIFKPLK